MLSTNLLSTVHCRGPMLVSLIDVSLSIPQSYVVLPLGCCLPLHLFPSTVPWRIIFARPLDRVSLSHHLSSCTLYKYKTYLILCGKVEQPNEKGSIYKCSPLTFPHTICAVWMFKSLVMLIHLQQTKLMNLDNSCIVSKRIHSIESNTRKDVLSLHITY